MKKVIKALSILLCLCLLITPIRVDAASQEETNATASFVVCTASASAGETVEVAVNAVSNPGIASARLKIEYDETRLKISELTYNGDWGGTPQKPHPSKMRSPFYLVWSAGTEDYVIATSTFVTLTFDVLDSAEEGDAFINISYTEGDICNTKEEDVPFECVKGKITIKPTECDHTPGTDWLFDETNHWHECTKCGEKLDSVAHTWDAGKVTTKPTESAEGVKTFTCTACGQIKTETLEKLPHEHIFSTEWTSDETNHWHASTCGHETEISGKETHKWDAGKTTKPATCTEKGEKTVTCTICEYTKTEEIPALGHSYADEWSKDKDFHWHACKNCCGEKTDVASHTYNWTEVKEATEKEEGLEKGVCSVCEYETTRAIPKKDHEHKYSDEWHKNGEGHWHECKCGEKVDVAEHTLKEIIDIVPTEESDGIAHDECEVCGFITNEGKVILPLKHTHVMEKVGAKPATCAEEGIIEHYTCTKCHKTFSDEAGENEIDAATPKDPANHTGETKVVGKLDSTCSKEGYTGDTVCAGCDAVLTKGEIILPTGKHEEEVRDPKEADCSNEGYTGDTYCKLCGEKLKDGYVIPKNDNHNFEWKVDVEPTFDETGLKHEECTRCGIKRSENTVIEKMDCAHSTMEHHEKVDATCAATGISEYWHCSDCGKNYSDEKGTLVIEDTVLPIDANNHVHTELRNVKPATCTTPGNSGDTYCTDCNTLVKAGIITPANPNAHNYINNICTYCGHVRVVYYPTSYTYLDDESHLASGMIARHVPDSMTMHTDGEYEWHYCMYCQHEYGKVPVVNINVDDTIDIVVDDPVQSGDDETIPDVPITEPEVSESVQNNNPSTGIAIALLPVALAAVVIIASKKTNK